MGNIDEPLFDGEAEQGTVASGDHSDLETRIRDLVQRQRYGVLCTQSRTQPYGSLVAFAFDEKLEHAVFATPVATRKGFVRAPSSALFRIDIVRFIHVARFQEVRQWTP
jgi:hypothetical protein